MYSLAEYIWIDGSKPTHELRSKTRVLQRLAEEPSLADFPLWNFDGSSTYQATGNKSDLTLKPVKCIKDPFRGAGNFLILCEVYLPDGKPHATNTRYKLQQILTACQQQHDPWVGFEQEYTLFQDNRPLGWPENEFPAPQGPYYCGVGSDKIFGREISDDHLQACLAAGLPIYGTNSEVMPGQWEFQLGYRGFDNEQYSALDYADHLWLARWLLKRVAEEYNVVVSLSNKPVKGDWNGAGCHTNFSTIAMRDKTQGLAAIERGIKLLSQKHKDHIAVYGAGNEDRLTGLHETCSIKEFRFGVADRGASVRIPNSVAENGCGYLEDRRPGANCDPYLVTSRLLLTICDLSQLEKAWLTEVVTHVAAFAE